MKIKTTQEIGQQEPDYTKKWIAVDDLHKIGIQIECQSDGSNNPEMLVDGIFIPYSELKEGKE